MAKVLTAKAIETAQATTSRREIPDGQLPGLYLVVQTSGAKSWALRYRFAGAPRKLTIGPVLLRREEELPTPPTIGQAMTLPEARTAARGAMQSLSEGRDPSAEKKAAKAAPPSPVDPERDLVRKLGESFVERYCKPRNKSWKEIERQFKAEINPHWGDRRAQEISRRDVLDLLDRIVDRGSPVTANRVFATVRKFFSWLIERDVLRETPCAGVNAPSAETPRDRILNDGEVRLFWRATAELGEPFGTLFRLLLLTGQRREEVGAMTWRELQLDGAEPTWQLPASRTKNGNPHSVPLSKQAIAQIKTVRRKAGKAGLLFTTTGETPVSGFSRAKDRLDAGMLAIAREDAEDRGGDPAKVKPVPHWTLHDLRRTAASGMARLNINLPVIEKLLNHVSGTFSGIVGVYQRHEFSAEKRAAMAAWGNFVDDLMKPTKPNVVPLRSRKQ
ncbi:tyrosine-type recombinase/integrase [Mesorhizobium huakuii]|uniref:Tyrosine-type recombinase/integrase n=1 Tax=Mesorhizobium huakuii TaxID=28104 RepID=A0A7G6SUP7_9HYPH|nr:site-specific integrase [Mesorhizobium huakuii]QND58229.1 tyrosine-type recombinase/integrase [Mesorhizobium huakuii]